ncbi:hypothetical protein [Microbacterium thalassium]|uniref:Capsular polysaccharide biosynthesis protein n=1 Tax=Microbacterium thalassium TaxID=362649 RepID=A0A7X0FMM6_9MICO|nr:hypothetical protein [Microbacterium thalassium]MBB6390261.1 capsular polysaccharide biosynthesis protein [Microbacterium thalassium]
MGVPRYLQVLWESKWLLLVGVLVAAVAAFFAGFAIVDGKVQSRAVQEYTAETTLLVSSPSSDMYQAVIPGQALVEGQTLPEETDLTSKAILYAYIISGTDMRERVETQVGAFSDTEGLTALRRTTQPGGDEAFPGRYTLPIIAVVGGSTSPDRAEEISDAAAQLFIEDVLAQQDESNIPNGDRVVLSVLDTATAEEVEGSNPAIPIAITFVGVFLLFVVAAFIVAGARSSRARKKALAAEQADGASETPEDAEEARSDEPVADSGATRRSRAAQGTSEEPETTPDEESTVEHEPSYTP